MKNNTTPSLFELSVRVYKAFLSWSYKNKLKKTIKQAESRYKLTRHHYLVLADGKNILLLSRRKAKEMIKTKQFANITNIAQLEKRAVYCTR